MDKIIDNPKRIKEFPILTESDKQRFWSKVNITNDKDECWEWNAYIEPNGYGIFQLDTPYKAHRLSFILNVGQIPKGLLTLHKCDNRKCVNPGHLFLGTSKDNLVDMVKKCRYNPPAGKNHWANRNPDKVKRGETCGASILNDNIVREIRATDIKSFRTMCEGYNWLAAKYKISERNIRRVLKKQIWKHI